MGLFWFERDRSRPESEGCWVAACSGDRLHPGEVETGVKSIAGLLSPVPGRCSVFQSYCKEFLLPQTYRCFGASFERDLSRPESEGSWVVVYSGDRLHYIQENRCWLVTPRLERGSGSQVRCEHPNHLIFMGRREVHRMVFNRVCAGDGANYSQRCSSHTDQLHHPPHLARQTSPPRCRNPARRSTDAAAPV